MTTIASKKAVIRMGRHVGLGLTAALAVAACGGGSGGTGIKGGSTQLAFPVAPLGQEFLSRDEVNDIVARAVRASQDRGVASVVAVTDRVGNVLALYQMNNSPALSTITSFKPDAQGKGLDGTPVPSVAAAIAKAITGAYLSSTGNAFTTRTASQIVQEFFQPGEIGQPSGPLYGVQFSQLPCSDLNVWNSQSTTIGPKRSPLGLSADPGGFPIYQNGRVVGGVAVMASTDPNVPAIYSLDANLQDVEVDLEEEIAMAALPENLRAPLQIRADRITANGQIFQYSNVIPAVAAPVADLTATGQYVAFPGYRPTAEPVAGVAYGTPASGYVATVDPIFTGLDTFNLVVDENDPASVRFPAKAAVSPNSDITRAEVQAMLIEGMTVANRARGQIRIPLGAAAQVTVSVIDNSGEIIGLVRSADAPIFGTDVSVQKARSALLLSSERGFTELQQVNGGAGAPFIQAMNQFFSNTSTPLGGNVAYSARAIGTVHRPYFPDAEIGRAEGPLSTPENEWSPFNIGLQLNISAGEVLASLAKETRATGVNRFDLLPEDTCVDESVITTDTKRYANGLQIFPGGFPIYRGDRLVGAIGISGDGVDQDDMIGYLGVINGAARAGTNLRPFPQTLLRADQIQRDGRFLKYVQCPQGPFNDSNEQLVCPGA